MRAIHPDFATSAYRYNRSWWVLAAALLAVTVVQVTFVPKQGGGRHPIGLASPDAVPLAQTVPARSSEVRPYASDALRWHEAATFNVDQVLRKLEETPVSGVRIVAIEMASAPARVVIEVECQSLVGAQDLVAALNRRDAGASGRWKMLSFRGDAADRRNTATVTWQ